MEQTSEDHGQNHRLESPSYELQSGLNDPAIYHSPQQLSRTNHRPSFDSTHSESSLLDEFLGQDRALLSRTEVKPLPAAARLTGTLVAFWFRNKGIIYVLLSQFFGSCMNVATRMLENDGNHGEGMHPFQLLFTRMFVTMVCSISYMYYSSTPDFPFGVESVRPLLILRGLGGFLGVLGLYYSLVYLPLSEAVVLTFLGPMFSCYVYSFIRPSEPFTRLQQIGACISIVGVIFIARPASLFSSPESPETAETVRPNATIVSVNATIGSESSNSRAALQSSTTSQHVFAILLGLIGVLGSTIALSTIRYIGKRAHPLISINYFATWCTFVSLLSFAVIPGVSFRLPANLTEWALLGFVGVNGFVMQVLLTSGLAYEDKKVPRVSGDSDGCTDMNTEGAEDIGDSNASAIVAKAERDARTGTDRVQDITATAGATVRLLSPDDDTTAALPPSCATTASGTKVSTAESGASPYPSSSFPTSTSPSSFDRSRSRSRSRSKRGSPSQSSSSSGTRATSMLYTQMIFALLFDRLIWGISPEFPWSWLGIVAILLGVILGVGF